MSLFVQLFEAIAVLVPDFLTLGLVTLSFFNLCSIARTLDVAGTLETGSALGVSLALGYLVTIAINVVGSLLTSARPTIATVIQSMSVVEQAGRESSPATLKSQPVRHEDAIIES
jgi:hypothetical protein